MVDHINFEELLAFIEHEDARLKARYGISDPQTRSLSRMVKLTEEVGELAEQVLMYSSIQRAEKLATREASQLPDEVADVLITTMLLAHAMDVDVRSALSNKITKIRERKY